jgi:formate/nitrite transporter FocA (FNT family)
MGFKHSIANWFFIPYGLMLDAEGTIPLWGAARNLAVVTCGNIVGGALLVAGIYWLVFLRDPQRR